MPVVTDAKYLGGMLTREAQMTRIVTAAIRRKLSGWNELMFVSAKFVEFAMSDKFPKNDPDKLLGVFREYRVDIISD